MTLMETIIESVRIRDYFEPLLFDSYVHNFFIMIGRTSDLEAIYARQDVFLDDMIRRRNDDQELMILLFDVISELEWDRRRQRIMTFVRYNQDPELLDRLALTSGLWESDRSAVPALQSRVDFLESLIPIMNTVELLNHKQRIEHMIQSLGEEIEREKRRDFMSDQF